MEVHDLVLGLDYVLIIRKLPFELLARELRVEEFKDRRTLFKVIAKDGSTTEQRIQIDIFALQESYSRSELSRLGWIPGSDNAADALIKDEMSEKSPLWRLMIDKKLSLTPLGSADVAV